MNDMWLVRFIHPVVSEELWVNQQLPFHRSVTHEEELEDGLMWTVEAFLAAGSENSALRIVHEGIPGLDPVSLEARRMPEGWRPDWLPEAPAVPTGKNLRGRSGNFNSDDALTSLLYDLVRDGHISIGLLEQKMNEMEEATMQNGCRPVVLYTNGWLAKYCADISQRIWQL